MTSDARILEDWAQLDRLRRAYPRYVFHRSTAGAWCAWPVVLALPIVIFKAQTADDLAGMLADHET